MDGNCSRLNGLSTKRAEADMEASPIQAVPVGPLPSSALTQPQRALGAPSLQGSWVPAGLCESFLAPAQIPVQLGVPAWWQSPGPAGATVRPPGSCFTLQALFLALTEAGDTVESPRASWALQIQRPGPGDGGGSANHAQPSPREAEGRAELPFCQPVLLQ